MEMPCSLRKGQLRDFSPFQPDYVRDARYQARTRVLSMVVEYDEAMRMLKDVATWRRRPGGRGLEYMRGRSSPIITRRAYIAGCHLRADIEHLRMGSSTCKTIDPTGVYGMGGGVGYAVPGSVYHGDVVQAAAFNLHALELHAVIAIAICEFAIIEWSDHLGQFDITVSRQRAARVMAGGLARLADALDVKETGLTHG